MPHLNEAWWQEVHLLTLGRLGGSAKEAAQTAKLIDTLLNVHPKPWRWLHRTDRIGRVARWLFPTWHYQRQVAWLLRRELTLAVQGYADARPEGRQFSVEKRLEVEIADLVAKGFRDRAVIEDLLTVRDPFVAKLVLPPAVQALGNPDRFVRSAAAAALGPSAAADSKSRAALLRALVDQD